MSRLDVGRSRLVRPEPPANQGPGQLARRFRQTLRFELARGLNRLPQRPSIRKRRTGSYDSLSLTTVSPVTPDAREMSEPTERPNLFFRLTTLAGALFVITILSLVASVFGDPQAPPARFLNAHGTTLILWQVGAILVLGLLAMTVDRRRTLRELRERGEQPPTTPPASDPSA